MPSDAGQPPTAAGRAPPLPAGSPRSGGGKRAHPGAEPEQPPAKQPRREAALPPHGPGGSGSSGREQLPRVAPASAATDRSSGSYADFWDPVWRYEHALVRYLRKAGQVGMAELYQRFPLPAIFPEPHTWGELVRAGAGVGAGLAEQQACDECRSKRQGQDLQTCMPGVSVGANG